MLINIDRSRKHMAGCVGFSTAVVIGFLRMWRGHELVTMDFFGVQKSKEKASEIKYCTPCLYEKSIHWTKPLMVQQAFSSGLCKEYCKAPPRDSHDPKYEAASRIMKELFPQHMGCGSNPTAEQNIATFGNIARSAYTTPPGKQSADQLTIFYNGMVNVYNVSEKQAKDIIRLAGNENSSQQLHSADCDHNAPEKPITISSTSPSNQTEEPLPLNPSKNINPKKLLSELPLQRKHSLQRFLQNRMEYRMTRAAPYSRAEKD